MKSFWMQQRELLYFIYKYSINRLKNSFVDASTCDLAQLIDFICFDMQMDDEMPETANAFDDFW